MLIVPYCFLFHVYLKLSKVVIRCPVVFKFYMCNFVLDNDR